MGRKRDKGFDGAPSKRRTILQIEKPSNKSGQKETKSNGGTSKQPKAHNPLGLLASYGDSDDDDDDDMEEEVTTQQIQQQSKGGFIGVGGTKPANEMDGMVADFLAEIDALDPEAPTEQPSEPGSTVQAETSSSVQESEAAPAPQPLPPEENGGWQELLDENTNCIYYWNTITNDVTWETPPEFKAAPPVAPDEPAPSTSQPSSGVSSPVHTSEPSPVVATEAPPSELVEEEPQKVIKPSIPKEHITPDVVKDVIKEDVVVKKVLSKPAPVKPPVLDMFADEVVEPETDFGAENKKLPVYGALKAEPNSKKMPVYGALKVEYDVSEDEEDEEEEEEDIAEEPELSIAKKTGMYSMFVKGDSLPASVEFEKKAGNKMTEKSNKMMENVVLGHLDITDDVDSLLEDENQVNGEAERIEEEEQEDDDDDDDVVEMDMGDEIDIDQQLELALERKKAELAELEEMEKVGSQSPAQKRKTSSPLNLYDENGEVNLLSFKKKRLENLKQQQQQSQRQTCDQATQCDHQLIDKMTADFEKSKKVKTIKEELKLKAELSELGSLLTNKLEFLGQATSKGLSKLHVLLVEIETRILDWREGALDGKHLLRKLQIADWELQRYESEAAPSNWTCTWNRTHRQYYYTNSTTGDSQWDYPVDSLPKEEQRLEQSGDETESRAMFNRASSLDDSVSSAAKGGRTSVMMHGNVTAGQLHVQAAVPPPQSSRTKLTNTSAPTPPSVPSPEPPPPPVPDDAPPLPRDPPPPGTGPDLPPLPPSPPPPPPSPPAYDSDDDDDASTGGSSRPLTPPPAPPPVPPLGISDTSTLFGQPPPPPETDGAVIGKPQILYTNAPTPASGLDGTPLGDYGGAPVAYGAAPVVGQNEEPTGGVAAPPPPQVTGKTKKTKKLKKSSTVKKKMPSSLVEKWKQIQEAQIREEEEKRQKEEEEDMVIDPNVIQQKRIEEWKKQQMNAGKSAYNPNFEMIKGDWRERLKRKGSKQ